MARPQCDTPLVWGSIIGYNPQEGFSIQWQWDRRESRILFFLNPPLFWRPRGTGLLNLANPVQNPYFFWRVFPEISRNIHCTGHSPKADFKIWRNFSPPKKKAGRSPQKLIPHFGETWSQKTKTLSQSQKWFRILAELGAKNQNLVTAPKLISHFGKIWSQKQKSSQS